MNSVPERLLLSIRRLTVFWLFLAAILLTLWLGSVPDWQVRALQNQSPLPTPTPTRPPPPTATPVQPPAATLIPTQPPPPTLTTAPATFTPVLPTQPLPTVAPLPTNTIIIIEPTVAQDPFVEATSAVIEESVPITDVVEAETIAPGNSDSLVLLIDTLVLSSAYFLLGCGLIIFGILAVFLFLLHRRSQSIHGNEQEPPTY